MASCSTAHDVTVIPHLSLSSSTPAFPHTPRFHCLDLVLLPSSQLVSLFALSSMLICFFLFLPLVLCLPFFFVACFSLSQFVAFVSPFLSFSSSCLISGSPRHSASSISTPHVSYSTFHHCTILPLLRLDDLLLALCLPFQLN